MPATGFYKPQRAAMSNVVATVRIVVPVLGEGGTSRARPGLSELHQGFLFGVKRVFPESKVRGSYKGSGQRFLSVELWVSIDRKRFSIESSQRVPV